MSSARQLFTIAALTFNFLLIGIGVKAAVIFELTDVSIFGSDMEDSHGQLEVLMRLTDDDLVSPPEIFSLNISFEIAGTSDGLASDDVAFGAPVLPSGFHLFNSPHTNNFGHTRRILHAQDIVDQPSGAVAFDGARLLIVPFSVNKGSYGTFEVAFVPFFNEATDHTYSPLDLTLNGGNVSITAIPEPSSLFGLALISFGLLRNRSNTP